TPAFGINASLRRIQIFRASFLVSREGASGEGNDFPRFVGDGKHDAVAELGVHRGFQFPVSSFRPPASRAPAESKSPPCPSKGRTDKDGAPSVCFHENSPLSRNTSSPNSFARRSRRRKPESGAYPTRKLAMVFSSSPRPCKYSRARAPSGRVKHPWKKAAARSWASSNCARSLASLASPGLEYVALGSGIPSFSATSRTASGKVMFSTFCTKLKTSPDTPQPKQ